MYVTRRNYQGGKQEQSAKGRRETTRIKERGRGRSQQQQQ